MKKKALNSLHNYFPLISDLVEDKVKNRCIYPLVIFALYVILVFIIVKAIDNVRKIFDE